MSTVKRTLPLSIDTSLTGRVHLRGAGPRGERAGEPRAVVAQAHLDGLASRCLRSSCLPRCPRSRPRPDPGLRSGAGGPAHEGPSRGTSSGASRLSWALRRPPRRSASASAYTSVRTLPRGDSSSALSGRSREDEEAEVVLDQGRPELGHHPWAAPASGLGSFPGPVVGGRVVGGRGEERSRHSLPPRRRVFPKLERRRLGGRPIHERVQVRGDLERALGAWSPPGRGRPAGARGRGRWRRRPAFPGGRRGPGSRRSGERTSRTRCE